MKTTDIEDLLPELKKTQEYVEKLLEGIHPITGKQISTNEVIYDYKVAKQFEFLDGYLKSQIKKLEDTKSPKTKDFIEDNLEEFELTSKELKNATISDKPTSLADVCNMLNHLRPSSNMRKLKAISAIEVLTTHGMIERQRRKIIPTEDGQKLGIQFKEFLSNGATLTKVVYSSQAQQFIIDHLPEITEVNKTKRF